MQRVLTTQLMEVLMRTTRLKAFHLQRFWIALAWIAAFPVLAAAQDPLERAVTAHGGQALNGVARIRMEGTSVTEGRTQRVVITASVQPTTEALRIDYGEPVSRSFINTGGNGALEVRGTNHLRYSPNVGAFAQMDMLSAFGVRHLATPAARRTVRGVKTVAGRPSTEVEAETDRALSLYRRTIGDSVHAAVDQETGLVAEILRKQYANDSLDIAFWAGFRFSDYRTVEGLVLPFRIDRVMDGLVRESITLERVILNPAFAPDHFAPPQSPARRTP